MIKEQPILMNSAMVRATVAGTKKKTRRIIKLPPAPAALGEWQASTIGGENGGRTADGNEVPLQAVIWHTRTGKALSCPHGQPGDRIWVRETWRSTGDGGRADYMAPRDMQPHQVWHDADGAAPESECTGKTRTSIHMPRWASRILLEIVSVRVERLNACSDADAVAEGIGLNPSAIGMKLTNPPGESMAIAMYCALWDSINGAGSWAANPWVWVVEFTRVTP